MKARDFCYWLMGALEAGKMETMDADQVREVRAHLDMVFIHDIDPTFPAKQQSLLNDAHQKGKGASGIPLHDRPEDVVMRC